MADSGFVNWIISARQPFLQADGTVTPAWYRYLEQLSQQANGGLTPADVLIDESTNSADGAVTQRSVDDIALLAWMAPDV